MRSCRRLFGRVGLTTREASTGYDALELAESSRPSLVLLDVELPGMSGYETCRELRNLYGETLPLVLLSGTRVEALDRIAGLLIGADDYIVKPFDPGELLARARLLLRRNGNGYERRNGHSPTLDSLTAREREVLDLLAEGRSQDEIAQELFITPKTVATHIQRVLGEARGAQPGPGSRGRTPPERRRLRRSRLRARARAGLETRARAGLRVAA